MATTAAVTNGKVVDYEATTAKTKTNTGNMGKDEFLQLLVAQMQYQDPLEPMDNTQYVSQLATFSQLEELQNVESAVQDMQASSLLGKQVTMVTTNSSGRETEVSGYVDYITQDNGTTKLGINGNLYSVDDLRTVVDEDYVTASSISASFSNLMSAMPDANALTLKDKDTVAAIRKTYDDLTDYQKSYISSDDLTKLEALEAQIASLEAQQGNSTDTAVENTSADTEAENA